MRVKTSLLSAVQTCSEDKCTAQHREMVPTGAAEVTVCYDHPEELVFSSL